MEIYLVYGITVCPACLRARADLMEKNKEYVFIETDFSATYRAAIQQEFEWFTFPIIVRIGVDTEEDLIGGYEDLKYVLEKGSRSPT